jgi:hypothetical protein
MSGDLQAIISLQGTFRRFAVSPPFTATDNKSNMTKDRVATMGQK